MGEKLAMVPDWQRNSAKRGFLKKRVNKIDPKCKEEFFCQILEGEQK